MKIAFLDPVVHSPWYKTVIGEMKKCGNETTVLDYYALTVGNDTLEYFTYEAMIAPALVQKVKDLENDYDAIIVGCFFDPYIDILKECCEDVIIVGVCEASVKIATSLGKKISVMAPLRKHAIHYEDSVPRYCNPKAIASIRPLDIEVAKLQADENYLHRVMHEQIHKALYEDYAEVIILGCTLEAGQYVGLQNKFHVPVIDCTVAALKMAEMLISCKEKCGWSVSKIATYATPPKSDLNKMGLSF